MPQEGRRRAARAEADAPSCLAESSEEAVWSHDRAPAPRLQLAAAALVVVGVPAVACLRHLGARPAGRCTTSSSRAPPPTTQKAAETWRRRLAATEGACLKKPQDGQDSARLAPRLTLRMRHRCGRGAGALLGGTHVFSAKTRRGLTRPTARRWSRQRALSCSTTKRARHSARRSRSSQAPTGAVLCRRCRHQQDRKKARRHPRPTRRSPLTRRPTRHGLITVDAPARRHWERESTRPCAADACAHHLAGAWLRPEQKAMMEGPWSRPASPTVLAANGGSIDEWSRLIRAYTVLHQRPQARSSTSSVQPWCLPPGLDAAASRGLGGLPDTAQPHAERRSSTSRSSAASSSSSTPTSDRSGAPRR